MRPRAVNLLGRLISGGHVAGEATRQAPAQAELRPTCAWASDELQAGSGRMNVLTPS
jgi:hypothetical protein